MTDSTPATAAPAGGNWPVRDVGHGAGNVAHTDGVRPELRRHAPYQRPGAPPRFNVKPSRTVTPAPEAHGLRSCVLPTGGNVGRDTRKTDTNDTAVVQCAIVKQRATACHHTAQSPLFHAHGRQLALTLTLPGAERPCLLREAPVCLLDPASTVAGSPQARAARHIKASTTPVTGSGGP